MGCEVVRRYVSTPLIDHETVPARIDPSSCKTAELSLILSDPSECPVYSQS